MYLIHVRRNMERSRGREVRKPRANTRGWRYALGPLGVAAGIGLATAWRASLVVGVAATAGCVLVGLVLIGGERRRHSRASNEKP